MNPKTFALAAVAAAAAVILSFPAAAEKKMEENKPDAEFALVNIEFKGSKIWLPGVIIVEPGDSVAIKLINNAPSGVHGFAIDEFGIKEAVPGGETRTVTFTIPKRGYKKFYRHYCHIHAAHIGGQILVEDED